MTNPAKLLKKLKEKPARERSSVNLYLSKKVRDEAEKFAEGVPLSALVEGLLNEFISQSKRRAG